METKGVTAKTAKQKTVRQKFKQMGVSKENEQTTQYG